ncbi:NrsF family protein [Paraurantiacibacter namhicola]|uniref:Anti-sigma-F factor NrsF n=1 Tax=Paraurantiacibacter namhicola TaxID=645517 RepID=A0A1C7D8Q0_9SPHN|nr:DUF1109 domain-containing protein [Paraurantiacibacter namhicola]ANU07815.1 hypothetical protein A6F65_01512 [Paraurantiacibacter namhicola]
MNTADLIARLADEGPSTHARPAMMILGWTAGAFLACLALLALVLGAPILVVAPATAGVVMAKLAFPLGIALAGGLAVRAAGVPGRSARWPVFALAAIFAVSALVVALEAAQFTPAFPGGTWARCVTAILLLTPVVFLASCRALRKLAPTNLRLAGGVAGLFSAAVGATAYAFWCPETTVTFQLAWYGGPIILAGAVGALLGPRLLRW